MASESGLGIAEAASSLSLHNQKALGLRESKLNRHKDPQTATNGRGAVTSGAPNGPQRLLDRRLSREDRRRRHGRQTSSPRTRPLSSWLAGMTDRLSHVAVCVCVLAVWCLRGQWFTRCRRPGVFSHVFCPTCFLWVLSGCHLAACTLVLSFAVASFFVGKYPEQD